MRKAAPKFKLTRRQFTLSGALAGAASVIGCRSSKTGNWDYLSDPHARTLAALCDQIIPADDFPSASQAGVVTYIDNQLARHYRPHRAAYREGLEAIDAMTRQRLGIPFADATATQQLQLVIDFEKQHSEFFDLVREHTMEGYYGAPRHGGNRDAVSWRMLGLDEPPLRGRAQDDLRKGGQS
jgi:gluconate 2-dehydrogenase gamma chain